MTINYDQKYLAHAWMVTRSRHALSATASLACPTVVMVSACGGLFRRIFGKRHIVELSWPRRCQGLTTRREVVRVTSFVQFWDSSCATREVLFRETALEISREFPITNNRPLQLFHDVFWSMALSPAKVIDRANHSWWIVTLSITLDLFVSLYALGRPFKGKDSICSKLICLTSSIASVGLSIFIGKRDKQSALACFVVEQYTISYWYKVTAQIFAF